MYEESMSLVTDLLNAKNVLHEVALHSHNLAMGLQNAAPPQSKETGPIKTVQYLLETAVQLEKTSQVIAGLLPDNEK